MDPFSSLALPTDGAKGVPTHMYRDGKEIPIAGGKWPTVSNFSGILLGVVGYHPVSPYEMWIDDVAIGTPTGEPFIAMEFLEGEDLEQRLRRVGSLPLAEAVRICKQVSSALAATHAKQIGATARAWARSILVRSWAPRVNR